MTAVPIAHFDLAEPIPEETLAIEASAGTGKTFTLAAMATRCLAELDLSASELLVVTFTRAATSELRSRIRHQIVDAAAYLRAATPPSTEDQLLLQLRDADPVERARRGDRLDRAVAELDTATITTIHGFATQMLGALGVNGAVDPDTVLVDDATTLVHEVCADVLAAAAAELSSADDLPQLKDLVDVVRIRLAMPDLVLHPAGGAGSGVPGAVLVELAERCVTTIGDRRRRRGTSSFDDVLVRLRDALQGDAATTTRAALAGRFQVALIDEFQDTDPVQWAIFSQLFGQAATGERLVLVGDPKQAIYSFRGADVHTFAEAVAPRPGLVNRALDTNWRSDGAMLTALNVLFDGASFGDDRIAYVPVEPGPTNAMKRLVDEHGIAYRSLSIRLALGPDIRRGKDALETGDVVRAVFEDVADHLVDLLRHARLPGDAGTDSGLGTGSNGRTDPVPIRPSDVAVLVRDAEEGTEVLQVLRGRGIPAVLARGSSVLQSSAAMHWRWLLEAMLRPSDPRRVRTFALSHFGGATPAEVADLDDERLDGFQAGVRRWVGILQDRGVSEWARQVRSESGVLARVLATADGDRTMTDLDHIAELFQAAASHGHLSVAGLLAVLDADSAGDAQTETDDDPTARRVESDEEAVQVMTVWVAKGLEFPIVCCPTLWRHRRANQVIYRDPLTGARTYAVVNDTKGFGKRAAIDRKGWAAQERLGENLRLLYVALTRAQHHTLLWWSRTPECDKTGLAHVLFARAGGVIDPAAYPQAKAPLPEDDAVLDALQPTLDRADGTITASVHGHSTRSDRWLDPRAALPGPVLEVARLDRTLDRGRRRWSFTAMTRPFETDRFDPYDLSLADRGAADELGPDELGPDELGPDELGSDEQGSDDRPGGDQPIGRTSENTRSGVPPATRSEPVSQGSPPPTGPGEHPAPPPPPLPPLAVLPAGAEFGTLVHRVLEQVDFTDDDLDGALAGAVAGELDWRPLDLTPMRTGERLPEQGRDVLVAGLRRTIETPLGPLAPGLRLRDVQTGDRLNELSFELPLGESGGRAYVSEIGRLVADHLEPADLLRSWAVDLAGDAFSLDLGGHLTGSIDVILRIGTDTPRFLVVDYKTNRLGRRGEDPRPDAYSRDALAVAMAEHHYPLQALLYSVALHRYLRWRLAGYDPARHLGGAAYLFLRGMSGADVTVRDGHPDGVFSWAIPPGLVTELSDLLDSGSTRRGRP